jgi:hypothetical protein
VVEASAMVFACVGFPMGSWLTSRRCEPLGASWVLMLAWLVGLPCAIALLRPRAVDAERWAPIAGVALALAVLLPWCGAALNVALDVGGGSCAASLIVGAVVTLALVALHARFVASVARRLDSTAPDAMERPTLLAMSLVVGAGALGRLHSRSQGLGPAESLAVLTALCAIAITARLALRRAERERWLVAALGSDHALRPLDMPTASLGEGLPALLGGAFRAGPALLVKVCAEGDAYRSAPTDEPVGWLVADPVEVVERARRDARAAWWVVGLQALVLLAANASWLVRRAVPAHACPERTYVSMNGERHFTDRP